MSWQTDDMFCFHSRNRSEGWERCGGLRTAVTLPSGGAETPAASPRGEQAAGRGRARVPTPHGPSQLARHGVAALQQMHRRQRAGRRVID